MTDIVIEGGIHSVTALRDALTAFSERFDVGVYNYRAPQKKREKYAVWGATAVSEPFWADDGCLNMRVTGQLWYYSIDAFDAAVNSLLHLLIDNGADCVIREIGYDDDLAQVVWVMDWAVTADGESGPY